MNLQFSEKKFCQLSRSLQHKKCAEMLRFFWQEGGSLRHYYELVGWMGEEPSPLTDKGVADRYHWHMREAKLRLKEHNLLPVRTSDRTESAPSLGVTIYLERIRSAYNVGSIIRSMEAFAIGELALSEGMADPTHKQVIDAAMGAEEWVPWRRTSIEELPRPLLAIETCEGAEPLGSFDFPEGCTIAFGNEEYGLSDELLAAADRVVEVPLFGRKNSLNVANCFAIVAAELRRDAGKASDNKAKA